MLATLAGFLALLLGLSLLLLPLLLTELSRPRDSAWGAVVLLLGLVLVTSADRLTGAPMLAVLCGGLLVGRLGGEVAQGRWRALTDEERQALRSAERWSRSLHQLAAVAAGLLQSALAVVATVSAWLAERRQGRSHGKRWVRSESAAPSGGDTVAAEAVGAAAESDGASPPDTAPSPEAEPFPAPAPPLSEIAPAEALPSPQATPQRSIPAEDDVSQAQPEPSGSADPGVRVVADFDGVDALLAAAREPEDGPPVAAEAPDASGLPAAPAPEGGAVGEAG